MKGPRRQRVVTLPGFAMSFKIKPNKNFSHQIRQEAADKCEDIAKGFQKWETGEAGFIQELRTHLKKIRILLRMVRTQAGKKFYGRENKRLREIAGAFSSARDLEVELKLLQELAGEVSDSMARAKILELQTALDKRHKISLSKIHGRKKQIQAEIRAARRRIKEWPLKKLARSDLKCGLKRAERRQREAWAEAKRAPTDAHLHEWRKRAKAAAQMRSVLRAILPDERRRKFFRQVSRFLGDDHDMAILQKMPHDIPRALKDGLSRRRAVFQKSAFDLAREFLKRAKTPT
jgi:CHAD domain